MRFDLRSKWNHESKEYYYRRPKDGIQEQAGKSVAYLSFRQRGAGKPDVEPSSGLHACDEFRRELKTYPLIRQSMSRKANGP